MCFAGISPPSKIWFSASLYLNMWMWETMNAVHVINDPRGRCAAEIPFGHKGNVQLSLAEFCA